MNVSTSPSTMWALSLTFSLSFMLASSVTYKPVIFMHGIFSDGKSGEKLLGWIKEAHPGTETLSIAMYEHLDSLKNMNEQVHDVGIQMMNFMKKHPEGINIICYSQGGLVCRGVLEQLEHNVHTFISLSVPQAGQFGDTDFVKYVFPQFLRDNVYRIAYTKEGQEISVGNYWNDPHHQDLYRNASQFLAVINNDTYNARSEEYRNNFLRLKQLVMIGGPNDGVITPWQSSHFGFYDKKLNIVEMKDQAWYKEDRFGLQTLDKRGALVTRVVPHVFHFDWHSNKTICDIYILPFLT
ncbi:holo-[acyl-carrier-protein] synthase [Mactra antiquata]